MQHTNDLLDWTTLANTQNITTHFHAFVLSIFVEKVGVRLKITTYLHEVNGEWHPKISVVITASMARATTNNK